MLAAGPGHTCRLVTMRPSPDSDETDQHASLSNRVSATPPMTRRTKGPGGSQSASRPDMPRVLVLADDLSGAADCGIAFTRSGLPVVVMLSDGDQAATRVAADVLALDADSRRLPPNAAAAVNARLARRYWNHDLVFYKKIDSTLRGNIAAELAALTRLAGLAIVAPAFPATGRITRGGRVYVHGMPLETTGIWQRAQLTGIADIVAILTRGGVRSTRAGLDLVRGKPDALRDAFDRMGLEGAAAVVCDAETDADLAAIAAASAQLARRHFWVGSAGLAHHLAPASGIVADRRPVSLRLCGPVLVAVGSRSDVSRVQARHLASEPGVSAVTVGPETLLEGESSPEWQAASARLDDALRQGADVLLTISSTTARPDEGWRLCAALGRLVAPFASWLGGLATTGGDTARGILGALGAVGLRLSCEIEPGVALGVTEGTRPLPVVTKAGAFGGPATLVHCRAVLSGAGAARS